MRVGSASGGGGGFGIPGGGAGSAGSAKGFGGVDSADNPDDGGPNGASGRGAPPIEKAKINDDIPSMAHTLMPEGEEYVSDEELDRLLSDTSPLYADNNLGTNSDQVIIAFKGKGENMIPVYGPKPTIDDIDVNPLYVEKEKSFLDQLNDFIHDDDQMNNINDRSTDSLLTTLLRSQSNAVGAALSTGMGTLTGEQLAYSHVKNLFREEYEFKIGLGEKGDYIELSSLPGVKDCLETMPWENYKNFEEAWKDVGKLCHSD